MKLNLVINNAIDTNKFKYNLKTDRYNDILLEELKIKIDSSCYLQYVITNLMKK